MPLQHMSNYKTGFSQSSHLQLFFMFQCNEHVEMDTFLCSLACTWISIIDIVNFILFTANL